MSNGLNGAILKAHRFGLSIDRNLMHMQTLVFKKGTFDIELSWSKQKFYFLVQRNMKTCPGKEEQFLKQIWVNQAKQLIKMFSTDLTKVVNGLVKITQDYEVDFSLIDKVISNKIGINMQMLQQAVSKQHLQESVLT